MLQWFAKRQIDRFERRWGYDAGYMRDILNEAGVSAMMPLNALQKVGTYRRDVPPAVYYAAKITASRSADCGPCLQLVTSMGEAAGVSGAVLRALVAGDADALPEDVRLGCAIARATIARDDSGDDARKAVLERWGRRGLVSLAYAIVAAQAYPSFKYALGHGHACARIQVAGAELALKKTVTA